MIGLGAPTIIGLAGRSAPGTGRGAAVSTVTTLSYLGFLIGPPLVGLISGASSLPVALTVVGALAAALALAALAVLRPSDNAEPAAGQQAHR